MAGGIDFQFNIESKEKKKERRRVQARQLYADLLDYGASPEHSAQLANELIQTGNFQFPSETYDMKKVSPNLFPSGKVPVHRPLLGGQNAIGVYDAQNPTKIDLLTYPRGVNVQGTIAKNKPSGGSENSLNKLTFYQRLAYERIKQAMKLGQENLDESAMASVQEDIKILPPEFQAEIEAGFEPNQVTIGEEPSQFAKKWLGAEREDTIKKGAPFIRFKPKGAANVDSEYQSDVADAQKAVSRGLIDRVEALARLRKKYGKRANLP